MKLICAYNLGHIRGIREKLMQSVKMVGNCKSSKKVLWSLYWKNSKHKGLYKSEPSN